MDSSHFLIMPSHAKLRLIHEGSSDELPHQRVSDSVFSPDIDKRHDL